MVKIIWSPIAVKTYESIITYLLANFGEAAAKKFVQTVDNKLLLIQSRPKMFRRSGKKPNTFITSVNKRTTLTYRYKPIKKKVELIVFWGMQNPANKPD